MTVQARTASARTRTRAGDPRRHLRAAVRSRRAGALLGVRRQHRRRPGRRRSAIRLVNPRGVSYLATAPGSLGLARAYIKGDLEIEGVHPGDPYELLQG